MPRWGRPRPREGAPVQDRTRTLWRTRRCLATGAGTAPLGLATWGFPSWSPRRVLTRPPADQGTSWVGCSLAVLHPLGLPTSWVGPQGKAHHPDRRSGGVVVA